jgi:hypothetical protein
MIREERRPLYISPLLEFGKNDEHENTEAEAEHYGEHEVEYEHRCDVSSHQRLSLAYSD